MIRGDVETFIVRVWVPGDGEAPPPNLHGTISHVESGRDGAFGDAAELLRFLKGGATRAGGREALSESSLDPESGG
jgi:hypothetical protein